MLVRTHAYEDGAGRQAGGGQGSPPYAPRARDHTHARGAALDDSDEGQEVAHLLELQASHVVTERERHAVEVAVRQCRNQEVRAPPRGTAQGGEKSDGTGGRRYHARPTQPSKPTHGESGTVGSADRTDMTLRTPRVSTLHAVPTAL